MPAPKIRFTSATITGLVLAKVGHPQRNEPLQTSKEVFAVSEEDQPVLTALFLKPFRNLGGHRFSHHASLEQHEMHNATREIFADPAVLLARGQAIAARLYAKSNHPNIKSGDLCVALIEDIEVDGKNLRALCLLKSESVVPFLSISTEDGDLKLSTEHGINPEKIDKGALILDHVGEKGHYVLLFDRSGADSRFWVRDFLAVVPVADAAVLTKKYADMAVSVARDTSAAARRAAGGGDAAAQDETPPWESCSAAREAISYFEGKDKFDLREFEREVLKTPEAGERFAARRAEIEEETGTPLPEEFEISAKDVDKAKRKIGAVVKLDTGVEIHIKAAFADQPEPCIERGFDEQRGMKFMKIYFNSDLTA
ncbi:MAG: nucleoid-associated protein [Luteolibacter sp.]